MGKLQGKVALVTGASKGIGAAIAKALALEGAAVAVNYASAKTGAEAVAAGIRGAGGQAVAIGGDVSKPAEAKALVAAAVDAFGRLDIVVNNAGIYAFAPLEEITEAQVRSMFDVNVLGLLMVTQAAVAHFKDGGAVINISSGATRITPPSTAVYTGTKGAVDVITGVLAKELGPRKIRVNAINPGYVETEGTHAGGIAGSEFEKTLIAQTPLGRGGQPEDIAKVAVFLASDDAGWLSGETLLAAGGMR